MTIAINGSGTITGITAGGLPDAIITQPEMATGVAGTGPAFSAYASATQSLTSAVYTKISCNTEEFDTSSCFDSTTNYRFTPNVAGYYQLNVNVYISSLQASQCNLAIYKNGSAFKLLNGSVSQTSGDGLIGGSVLVYLNGSTDYVEFYAIQFSGSARSTSASSLYTYFQGALVRAA